MGPSAKIEEPVEKWLGVPLGHLAVNAFFVISGFLITRSYLSRKNLFHYLRARVLRIYPAHIAATLFCALVVGAFFTELTRPAYFKEKQTRAYITHNFPLLFSGVIDSPAGQRWTDLPAKTFSGLEYTLPEVFTHNPLPRAINIPIWTLPWELLMYLSVVIFGMAGLLARPRLLASFTLLIVTAYFANDYLSVYRSNEICFTLQFFSFFYLGALVQLYKHKILLRYAYLVFSVALLVICFRTPFFKYLLYLSLVYWVFLFAFLPGGQARLYNKAGDYSYGLYVYCFPIQQSIVALFPMIGALPLFCAAFAFTLPIAMASWHYLELPLINQGRIKQPA